MAAFTFEEVLKASEQTTEPTPEQKDGDTFSVFKTDDDKRLVFGWASISITVDGEQLEDRQKDIIDPEDLEEAAYEYVLNFRDTGEEHIQTMRKKGKLVESCVFTAEKQKAMGIPEGTLPIGWWIGFKIEDDAAWERVKNGTYRMFSIEGKANREPVEKGNPYHDDLGRFTTGGGGGAATRSAPTLKSAKEFDDYVEKNGLKKLYRGYSAATQENLDEYEESIRTGTSSSSGEKTSALGKGVYFANDHTEAEGYMNRRKQENGDQYGRVTTAALDVGAKTGDFNEYQRMKFEAESELNKKAVKELVSGGGVEAGQKLADQAMEIRQMSVPEYAATKGLDALYDNTTGYTVVMNQNALVVKVDGVAKSKPVAKTFLDILKFNPFHDARGRFSNANGYAQFTVQTKDPKKQHWADMAIARMKQQAETTTPKPTKNYDAKGFADYDEADYHQLHSGAKYYKQQQLTKEQKQAAANYLESHTESGSLYSHCQNMNYMMATGKTLTGQYKKTHDGMMSAMHNMGYNVELTRYDHAGMVNGMLKSLGAGTSYERMSQASLKKALVGQTVSENKFLSASYNDFKNAPNSSVFTSRAVKINYKVKAGAQAMMPGKGAGGDFGEIVLAPTNGKANKPGRITDVRLTGQMMRRQGTQTYNQPRIEIDIEIG